MSLCLPRRALPWTAALVALLVSPAALSKPVTVTEAAPGSPEAVVLAALAAALDADDAKGFEAYLALVHPDRKSTEEAVEQLRRYSWLRFRKQAPDYVAPGTKGGFVVERQDPGRVGPETPHVRLFLLPVANARRTFATPIRLERSDGRWLVTANSL